MTRDGLALLVESNAKFSEPRASTHLGFMTLTRCNTCHSEKPPDAFSFLLRGPQKGIERSKECIACSTRRRKRRSSKKASKRKQQSGNESDGGSDEDEADAQPPMGMEALLEKLRGLEAPVKGFRARVNTAGAVSSELEPVKRARDLAKILGDVMLLHWT